METATTGSTVSRGRTVPAENDPVSVSPPRAATVSKRPQPSPRTCPFAWARPAPAAVAVMLPRERSVGAAPLLPPL